MKQFITIALATVFLACNNNETQSAQKTNEHTQKHQSPEHNNETLKITLNNGKKWKANPETTQGIENMLELIDEFKETSNKEKYSLLKHQLEQAFSAIITKCSMKGEAHNQLHHYLIPLREMIKTLDDTTHNKPHETLLQIKKHLHKYPAYFQ